MELLVILLVFLVITRVLGEISLLLGQAELIGELCAGITIGILIHSFPTELSMFQNITTDPTFNVLTEFGIIFLMLYGGVSLKAKELAEVSINSLAVSICGLILPLLSGFALAWAFIPEGDLKFTQCLFVGTALSITAIPVSIRVLIDLGKLDTLMGKTIVAAAIIDDVLSLIVLAFLTGMLRNNGLPNWETIPIILGSCVLFFFITYILGKILFSKSFKFMSKLKSEEIHFSILLISCVSLGILAELLHLHYIMGAFVTGLLFDEQVVGPKVYKHVKEKLSAITFGLFVPIFFASIGIHLDISAILNVPLFLFLLLVVAFASKLIGAGVPAYILGMSKVDSAAIGIGMCGRGAVELIVADIALKGGLFEGADPTTTVVGNLFSAIVFVSIVTTMATPFVMKWLFYQSSKKEKND